MNKNQIREYINNYDFNEIFSVELAEFLKKPEVIQYLNINSIDNLKEFSKLFWNNPTASIKELKKKFSIPNSISFISIIRAFQDDIYIRFLHMVWDDNVSINHLVGEFCIPYNKMIDLIHPVFYNSEVGICPYCLKSNEFLLDGEINDIKNNNYKIICLKCDKVLKDRLLSLDEAEGERQAREEKKEKFIELIDNINMQMKDIKCPKCQSDELTVISDKNNLEYKIVCQNCKHVWNDIEIIIGEYEEWCKRAAIMIAIKEHEKEQIEEALKNKRSIDLILKNEDIIKDDEGKKSIFYAIEQQNDLDAYWSSLYKYIKSCSRTEKLILIKIIELCSIEDSYVLWDNKDLNNSVRLKRFTCEKPIVSVLFEHTKMLNIRKSLRLLIKGNVIACSEESNFIDINPVLELHRDRIQNLLKSDNISPDIKYLILKRDNYTCYNCGENGRPLKIAYLSTDKNPNDLDKLIVICDNCYDDITENEVLIDGTVVCEQFRKSNGESIHWEFLICHMPELQNDMYAYKKQKELCEEFGEENLIKALAVTIYKSNNDGLNIGNIFGFYRYTEAILRNANDGIVHISKAVAKECKVKEWIGLIN